VPQTCPPLGYNELDKVNKKVNDMERMIRELKDSNERMMRTMSEQFANREKGTFPSQPEANPRGGSYSHFFLLDLNCIILYVVKVMLHKLVKL